MAVVIKKKSKPAGIEQDAGLLAEIGLAAPAPKEVYLGVSGGVGVRVKVLQEYGWRNEFKIGDTGTVVGVHQHREANFGPDMDVLLVKMDSPRTLPVVSFRRVELGAM